MAYIDMNIAAKTFISGLLLAEIGLGAYLLLPHDDESGPDRVISDSTGDSRAVDLSGAPAIAMNKVDRSGLAPGSTRVPEALDTVRDSLRRDDPVSAKASPTAAATAEKDNSEALQVQRELLAREELAKAPPQSPQPGKPALEIEPKLQSSAIIAADAPRYGNADVATGAVVPTAPPTPTNENTVAASVLSGTENSVPEPSPSTPDVREGAGTTPLTRQRVPQTPERMDVRPSARIGAGKVPGAGKVLQHANRPDVLHRPASSQAATAMTDKLIKESVAAAITDKLVRESAAINSTSDSPHRQGAR
jgi:hypothetical protein